MKPSELIAQATKAGCETITDYAEWCYAKGQLDTLSEVVADIKDVTIIPEHINKAIEEGINNEKNTKSNQ